MVAWLKDNLPRPTQMLSTGCSAGGVGSLTNYHPLRRDMAPTRGFLIDDSGPVFPTPAAGDPQQYPSQPLHTKIREAWGLDGADGPLNYLAGELPQFDLGDLGTLYPALSAKLPQDRLGHTHFWKDLNDSSYSCERFFPEFEGADQETREALLYAKWDVDTARLHEQLAALANFGGYFPQYRALNESHCTTIVDFKNGDVQAQRLDADAARYERAGELSAGESLLLRIGLIKAMGLDEREQAERMSDLMERYRVESERRSAAWAQQQQRDPRFRSYKSNERGIVEEVMAMRTIPGGLSRDEYLRQRLQQAREAAWRTPDS